MVFGESHQLRHVRRLVLALESRLTFFNFVNSEPSIVHETPTVELPRLR